MRYLLLSFCFLFIINTSASAVPISFDVAIGCSYCEYLEDIDQWQCSYDKYEDLRTITIDVERPDSTPFGFGNWEGSSRCYQRFSIGGRISIDEIASKKMITISSFVGDAWESWSALTTVTLDSYDQLGHFVANQGIEVEEERKLKIRPLIKFKFSQ